ncbi:hypothetical protein IFT69_24470 [Pseudomonas putida]|nr:hypothetical protein [Pseudomonas putida]
MELESIYDDLLSQARPQQQRSLAILHEVLRICFEQKEVNFSIANIARYSVAAGGPSASSIRNKTGFRFRILIDAWAAKAGTTRKMPANPNGRGTKVPDEYELLRLIPDAAVRACFSQIIAERNRFLNELNILKARSKIVIDLRPPRRKSEASSIQVFSALPGLLNTLEFEALRAAIDPEFLEDQGWRVTAAGQVKDQSGELYKHGYATAIRKILDEAGSALANGGIKVLDGC